ncbi:MAG: hypothetical protein AUI99_05005 [Gemmatimonadetes bacterium 13_1_40CM_3_69_22]|nr:MAG: hypothetical protein AUH12_00245 [Gemmatimonadetes bacterium 13_2_20CM_69_8]OLD03115.1 MAG: hypothetical protein AUI99_05005 [Gemmatimonadetes bacterium 13_1_40CM_3_69_22]OLD94919.1 MAG: hypothetical protein AUG79_07270 [Gemmatimonadetes bacterium 13_1_20CM_4_69_16]PYO15561.1 MAG: hypothetical protein DMD31_04670 [Gemmatimonadota bacterium]
MTAGTHARAASLAAGWSLLVASAPAQTAGTLDVGISTVRYDGFLPSGAVTATPALRWERPGVGISARGTYLRFESGHRSLQGDVTGSLFAPRAATRWRGELAAGVGASRYVDFASFWHAVAAARLHLLEGGRGAWISGTAGTTSYGTGPRTVAAGGAGAWLRLAQFTVQLSVNHSHIGDTTYTDLQSSARAEPGPVVLEGTLGARLWSRGGGRGSYGEASAAISLGPRTALMIGGGRYPTDPIRGSVAGRYLTLAVRVRAITPRRVAFPPPRAAPRGASADDGTSLPAARLQVLAVRGGPVRIVVHVADATRVELAGDFTDWEPLALTSTGPGEWEAVIPIVSGVHRINVRIDGTAWIVPAGTTRAPDDYGSGVGIFVVP